VVRGQNGTTAISTIAVADVVTPGNPPGQSGVSGGSLLIHADHGSNVLASGDSIQYTVKLQYT
jgi:GTPase involved in cell partitioning and DNA repair